MTPWVTRTYIAQSSDLDTDIKNKPPRIEAVLQTYCAYIVSIMSAIVNLRLVFYRLRIMPHRLTL